MLYKFDLLNNLIYDFYYISNTKITIIDNLVIIAIFLFNVFVINYIVMYPETKFQKI